MRGADLPSLIRAIRFAAFDFDGVVTDNTVYVFEDDREAVRCSRTDGIGLKRLTRLGLRTLTGPAETNPVVSARAGKLGVPCVQGSADKRAVLDEVLRENSFTPAQAAFVGNDVNDLLCLTAVALPIVVAEAHPDVILYARYRTKAPGGHGAVREVCDLIADVLEGKTI